MTVNQDGEELESRDPIKEVVEASFVNFSEMSIIPGPAPYREMYSKSFTIAVLEED